MSLAKSIWVFFLIGIKIKIELSYFVFCKTSVLGAVAEVWDPLYFNDSWLTCFPYRQCNLHFTTPEKLASSGLEKKNWEWEEASFNYLTGYLSLMRIMPKILLRNNIENRTGDVHSKGWQKIIVFNKIFPAIKFMCLTHAKTPVVIKFTYVFSPFNYLPKSTCNAQFMCINTYIHISKVTCGQSCAHACISVS